MLVLSRKKNESVVINNDITVTVVEIRGDKVRLGFVYPKEVPVHRQEVYDAIHGSLAAPPTPPTTTVTKAPPPPPIAPVSVAPVVQVTDDQAASLDRLAAALKSRAGVTVDRHALAQAILDAALKQYGSDAVAVNASAK